MIPERMRPIVLIVDDDEANLVALSALLAGEDVDVITVRSGHEALEVLLVEDVAVALIDVHMPGMDGFELAELMRGTERTRLVPIIFVTGGSQDEQRRFRGYDTGAVDYLYKPVEPPVLRNKVLVFLDLWRQRQHIAETLRLHEMFTAVLSHDLRNPLSVIASGATLLERGAPPETAREVGHRIRRTTERMSAMINDLLDLSRARLSTGIPVERGAVDLGALAEAVCDEQQLATPDLRVHLECRGCLEGAWDAARVSQALTNLLSNAARHGDDDQVCVRVDGRATGAVHLEVRNRGTIPPELLSRLFEPFSRGGEGHGLGLGLYIVREIARAHGGDVEVESHPRDGTCFRLVLPRQDPHAP